MFARCGVPSVCECVCVLKARGSRAGVTFSRREAEMSRLVACGSWAAAAVCAWLALNLACLMRVESRAHMVQGRAKVKRLQSHCKVRVVGKTERESPPQSLFEQSVHLSAAFQPKVHSPLPFRKHQNLEFVADPVLVLNPGYVLWSGQEKTETFTVHNYSLGGIFAVSCELLCTEQGDG